MMMPLNDSGANSYVVEALTCGLNVATTDVGGIRDYGGGYFLPIVVNNDDDAMVAFVEKYCANPAWRDEVSRRCRQFTEQTLAWPLIAQRHLTVYRELTA